MFPTKVIDKIKTHILCSVTPLPPPSPSYRYLGSTVNSDNSIEEEIQCRITLGNQAYYTNQFLFKRRLVSKKSKLKLYWSIIRPTVTYGCEVWVLKGTIKKS